MGALRTEQIYEGLFDDDAFAGLPRLLAEAGSARSGLMLWRHRDGGYETLNYSYFSADIVQRIPQFLPLDPWTIAGMERQNRLLKLDDYVSPESFDRSIVYNDLVRAHGDDTFHCVGTVFSSPFGMGILSVHRGRTAKPFEARDAAGLEPWIGHFKKVLRVRGELSSHRRAAEMAQGSANTLGLVMITVRADRRILQTNAAAEALLRRANGLASRNRVLTAVAPGAAERLAKAVSQACAPIDPVATTAVIERGPGLAPYLVTAAPVIGAGAPAALVLLRDPDFEDSTLAERLRSLFGLTAAEASIAVELAKGHAIGSIALTRGVSENTLRAQLKAVSAKMGVSRQSEVAAIVAAMPQVRS